MKNNKEQWKDIPHYEGLYEASTFGRIRSKEGKITYSNIETGKKKKYLSLARASRDIGRCNGYISNLLKNKKYIATSTDNRKFLLEE